LKKVTLISLILTTSFWGFSQNVTLALTKMNLLYYGLDNPISLSVNGIPKKKWAIQSSEGIEINENYSSIKVLENHKSTEFVYVGYNKRNTTFWIDTIPMRVRHLPNPTAQWGNLSNSGLPRPKVQIAAQTHIKASLGS
jgi:hypothetical protein